MAFIRSLPSFFQAFPDRSTVVAVRSCATEQERYDSHSIQKEQIHRSSLSLAIDVSESDPCLNLEDVFCDRQTCASSMSAGETRWF